MQGIQPLLEQAEVVFPENVIRLFQSLRKGGAASVRQCPGGQRRSEVFFI